MRISPVHGLSRALMLAALALFCSAPAHAVLITSSLTAIGGDEYRYDYTVTNDGAIASEVRLFDILFDPTLYDESSLTIVSIPALAAAWDQILLASGSSIPAAFDALAIGAGIGIGESVAGFAVQFKWLGSALPGLQLFEIYDAETFELLGGGTTTLAAAPVPEPATVSLLLVGMLLAFGRRRANGSAARS